MAVGVSALSISAETIPVTTLTPITLGKIPPTAAIVYIAPAKSSSLFSSLLMPAGGSSHIYVMDRDGGNASQITFEHPRNYEHVAVSHGHRYIIANEQLPNPTGHPGGFSRLWLFDLEKGTEAQLLPKFTTAGNGGVAWDKHGFIYFSAQEKDIVSHPLKRGDFVANATANQVYRVKFDGTGLKRLTHHSTRAASDVSVSEDGTLITYNAIVLDPLTNESEIWVAKSDGSNSRVVYKGGIIGTASVHDPELSPDNRKVAFSKVNSQVPPNFPDIPEANTAHDLWMIGLDGKGLKRITRPGPISIIPNWQMPGDLIVYTDLSVAYRGISVINADETEQPPKRIKDGASSAKWIPGR